MRKRTIFALKHACLHVHHRFNDGREGSLIEHHFHPISTHFDGHLVGRCGSTPFCNKDHKLWFGSACSIPYFKIPPLFSFQLSVQNVGKEGGSEKEGGMIAQARIAEHG